MLSCGTVTHSLHRISRRDYKVWGWGGYASMGPKKCLSGWEAGPAVITHLICDLFSPIGSFSTSPLSFGLFSRLAHSVVFCGSIRLLFPGSTLSSQCLFLTCHPLKGYGRKPTRCPTPCRLGWCCAGYWHTCATPVSLCCFLRVSFQGGECVGQDGHQGR